jgi:molybdopterin converting factor small subunit
MPKVHVTYISSFRPALGGEESLHVQAKTLRELMGKILKKYPRMQKHLDTGVAVAINGEIYRDDLDLEIPEGVEVYLMPRIQGG